MSTDKKILKNLAIIFVLTGLGLIFLSIIVQTVHLMKTKNEFLLWLNEFVVNLFSHIGIGLLILGIVSFVLEIPHWMEYFESRLKDVVIKKSFLSQLDERELLDLQTNIMRVYFKDDGIGKTGGFMDYYQKNIQKIIGMPFRENVSFSLNIKEYNHEGSNEYILINETLSYKCRENSGNIQREISYIPDQFEHFKTLNFSVNLQHSKELFDGENNIEFTLTKLEEIKAYDKEKNGFKLPLDQYNIDGLIVVVKASYLIYKNRFFNWRMLYPTFGMQLNVSYPEKYTLIREHFVNNEQNITESYDEVNKIYSLVNGGWLMPGEGVSLQLLESNYHQQKDVEKK